MADDSLEIQIKLSADLAAAQETVAELKELKRQAVAAGVSTGDLDKQITSAERSAGQFTKQISEGGQKGVGHIQGLHRAIGFLGRQFGEVGHLAHFALSLPALGIAALGLGIAAVVEHFTELQKKIDEAQKKLEELQLAKINGLRDATTASADAMERFNLAMAAANGSKDPLQGQKFNSPEEELYMRQHLAPGLDAAATAAMRAAAANKTDPFANSASKELAAALAAEPELKHAIHTAGEMGWAERAKFGPEADFNAIIAERVAKAQAAFNQNQSAIAGYRNLLGEHSENQLGLDAAAGHTLGLATGNRSAMTTLRERINEVTRVRRLGLEDQFNEAGFGEATSRFLPGAGAAAAALANHDRASAGDAVDYNMLLSQVKAGMAASFVKALQEVFDDGVVTPEEMARLKAFLDNKSQRP